MEFSHLNFFFFKDTKVLSSLHALSGVDAQDLRFTTEQAQSLLQTFLDLGSEEGDSPSPRISSVYELRNLYI